MLIRRQLRCLPPITLLFVIVSTFVPVNGGPLSWIYPAASPKQSIDDFIADVAAEWTELNLTCDDPSKCSYNIDPDMSAKYSDLFVDSCTTTNLNETKLGPDGKDDFDMKTDDGSILAVKTMAIPTFRTSCNVHFNKDGRKAADYTIKGSNNKESMFALGIRFDKSTQTTKVFMLEPKENLQFAFVAR